MTPVVKNGKTFANEQEYITWLEQQNAALVAKTAKTKPGIEFRVTLEEGFFQIRRLTSNSINLPIEAVRWIIEHAQDVLKFEAANKNLLFYKADGSETEVQKLLAREANLKTDNPVVRLPRAANKTQETE